MKNRFFAFAAALAVFAIGSVSPAFADSIFAKDGIALFANDDLLIIDTATGSTIGTILIGNAPEPIGHATEVTAANCKAIVTTIDDEGAKDYVVVDLSTSGLPLPADFCDDQSYGVQCLSTFNPSDNVLSIPCVEAFGAVYTVRMARRGNSDNWNVTFIEEVK